MKGVGAGSGKGRRAFARTKRTLKNRGQFKKAQREMVNRDARLLDQVLGIPRDEAVAEQ